MEIREILRQIRAGESDRAIGRNLRVHRATVKKYREWASEQGFLEGELPPIEELQAQLAGHAAGTSAAAARSVECGTVSGTGGKTARRWGADQRDLCPAARAGV